MAFKLRNVDGLLLAYLLTYVAHSHSQTALDKGRPMSSFVGKVKR